MFFVRFLLMYCISIFPLLSLYHGDLYLHIPSVVFPREWCDNIRSHHGNNFSVARHGAYFWIVSLSTVLWSLIHLHLGKRYWSSCLATYAHAQYAQWVCMSRRSDCSYSVLCSCFPQYSQIKSYLPCVWTAQLSWHKHTKVKPIKQFPFELSWPVTAIDQATFSGVGIF